MSDIIDIQKAVKSGVDDDKAIDQLLAAYRMQLTQADASLEDATIEQIGKLMSQINITLANASHRNKDATIRKRLLKMTRQLLHMLPPLLEATDPGDLQELYAIMASLHFSGATTMALNRVKEARRQREHDEAVAATEGDVEVLEEIRKEQAEAEPLDGADADLAESGEDFSEDDL
jgi:hypothetical protein